MKISSNRVDDKYDQIDIRLPLEERQDSMTRMSVQTTSSGNLPAHTMKFERPSNNSKHLGDYLSPSSMNKPPKPR